MAPCNLRGAEKCWPLAKCLLVVGGKVAKWSVGLEVSELVRCKLCSCLAPLLHCIYTTILGTETVFRGITTLLG